MNYENFEYLKFNFTQSLNGNIGSISNCSIKCRNGILGGN